MRDMRGNDFWPGDEIAVAMRNGNTATMRIGVVKELLDDTNELVVEWSLGSWLPARPGTIQVQTNRIVIL